MSMLSPLYPRGPVNLGERLRELPVQGADIDFPQLPEWRVIHTPGHTAGHVSLFRAEDRTLVVGDAFCTTKPESFFEAAVVQQPELHGPPAYFTSDWEQAGISVRMLAELNPAIVAPGHGKPLAGERVAAGLHELAEEFGEVAVRENEKHVA
jgi:glyoxylase-like metal-dependent hydrolase (beta-lactamase superfamily II)